MGYTFRLTIPASGGGSRPINVSGQTLLICADAQLDIAYDENGFNTGQYMSLPPATAQPPPLYFPVEGKTVLWVRTDPDIGSPAVILGVFTDIGSVNL